MKYSFLIIFILIAAFFAISRSVFAEDIEMVNRPVNSSGLTGLLFTTSPYTITTGTVEIGASIQWESSLTPNYTIIEYPLTVTVGIAENSELALRASYINLNEGPTVTAPTNTQEGSIELSYKWNFFPPLEESARPAVALIVTGIAPIENNSDPKINEDAYWGMRLGISAGTEISWKEHILGIYADAQFAGQERFQNLYEMVNAGILLPISKYRNLQMFVEYNMVHGNEKLTIDGANYTALTYGLRLVTTRFNLTLGTQYLRKQVPGYTNTNKVVGLASVNF